MDDLLNREIERQKVIQQRIQKQIEDRDIIGAKFSLIDLNWKGPNPNGTKSYHGSYANESDQKIEREIAEATSKRGEFLKLLGEIERAKPN